MYDLLNSNFSRIVRQEAVNALDKFANDKDVSVKAVQLLSHPEAKVRQVLSRSLRFRLFFFIH